MVHIQKGVNERILCKEVGRAESPESDGEASSLPATGGSSHGLPSRNCGLR